MPDIIAKLNYLRISPRKVRAVAELIKGLDVIEAEAQLKYITRKPAKPLLKLLNSAVSNAKHNFNLNKNFLYIKDIIVNEGIKLKRFKPKGFGLVMPIHKKTSRIELVLDELPEKARKKKELILAKIAESQVEHKTEEGPEENLEVKIDTSKVKPERKPQLEKELTKVAKKGVLGGIKSLGRRIFRRKKI